MNQAGGHTEESVAKVRNMVGSLEKNRDHIHHETDCDHEHPIGSCGIGSSHRYVCPARTKRAGTWWVTASGNNMLRVRSAVV